MRFEAIHPSAKLAHFVASYQVLDDLWRSASYPAVTTSYLKFSGDAALFSAQTSRPQTVELVPGSARLAVELRIGAAYILFGHPAHHLTDHTIPIDALFGQTGKDVVDKIASADTIEARVGHLEAWLGWLVHRAELSDRWINPDITLKGASEASLAVLAERMGYSERQLRRKFNELTGFCPRLFRRLQRFERAIALLSTLRGRQVVNWPDTALSLGYADQSHFIREFGEFAGQTPVQYVTMLNTAAQARA